MDAEKIPQSELSQGLELIFYSAWPEVLGVLWISLLTMAVLQVYKDFRPIRANFHRKRFLFWLYDSPAAVNSKISPFHVIERRLGIPPDGEIDRNSVYGLPLDQFVAQLGAVAFRALESVPELREGIVYSEEKEELDRERRTEDGLIVDIFSRGAESFETAGNVEEYDAEDPAMRARRSQQIQRNLDALMAHIGRAWRSRLRRVSMGISFGLLVMHLAAISFTTAIANLPSGVFAEFVETLLKPIGRLVDTPVEIVGFFSAVLIAGYLAPVLHDIFVRLQGGRERR